MATGERVMSTAYVASGGPSLEMHVAESSIRAESHEGSFSFTLPTFLAPYAAWLASAPFLSSPVTNDEFSAINGNGTGFRGSSAAAIERLRAEASGIKVVRLSLTEDVFVWADDTKQTEVGYGFTKYDAEPLFSIIRAVGSPVVQECAEEIVALAEPVLLKYATQ